MLAGVLKSKARLIPPGMPSGTGISHHKSDSHHAAAVPNHCGGTTSVFNACHGVALAMPVSELPWSWDAETAQLLGINNNEVMHIYQQDASLSIFNLIRNGEMTLRKISATNKSPFAFLQQTQMWSPGRRAAGPQLASPHGALPRLQEAPADTKGTPCNAAPGAAPLLSTSGTGAGAAPAPPTPNPGLTEQSPRGKQQWWNRGCMTHATSLELCTKGWEGTQHGSTGPQQPQRCRRGKELSCSDAFFSPFQEVFKLLHSKSILPSWLFFSLAKGFAQTSSCSSSSRSLTPNICPVCSALCPESARTQQATFSFQHTKAFL